MDKIIQVSGLKKSYGSVQAVKGLEFYCERGGFFAFLGPNGAGKSTTIDIICTFLKPDSGEVIVDGKTLGKNDDEIRSVIGVVFQDGLLDRILTVKENLLTRARLYGLRGNALKKAVNDAAEWAGAEDIMSRPYGRLSGGQRRRADIARALVNRPKILFLDEPTTGLDPQTRKHIWETVERLRAETGMTVFMTTHYMEEAASADYVIIIDNGMIAAKGTPDQLKNEYASDTLKLYTENPKKVISVLDQMDLSCREASSAVILSVKDTMDTLPILERLKDHINGYEVFKGSMDDVFLGVTGKELRE